MKRMPGTLHEDLCTFTTISSSVLLRMKTVSDEILYRKSKQHILFSNNICAFREKMWTNVDKCGQMWTNLVHSDRPQMTIWRMGIACCIPKATDTHS